MTRLELWHGMSRVEMAAEIVEDYTGVPRSRFLSTSPVHLSCAAILSQLLRQEYGLNTMIEIMAGYFGEMASYWVNERYRYNRINSPYPEYTDRLNHCINIYKNALTPHEQ